MVTLYRTRRAGVEYRLETTVSEDGTKLLSWRCWVELAPGC